MGFTRLLRNLHSRWRMTTKTTENKLKHHIQQNKASQVAQWGKNLPAIQGTWVRSLSWEDFLEKGIATYSRILAWRIPWTEEPGGLQSMGVAKSLTWLKQQNTHTQNKTNKQDLTWVENQLAVDMRVHFWALTPTPLVCMFFLTLVSHCLA